MMDVALLFPPLWYFAAVPADLSYTAGRLQAEGLRWMAWDGSAAFNAYHHRESLAALQQPGVLGRHGPIVAQWRERAADIGRRHQVRLGIRRLRFDVDEGSVTEALSRGMDPFRNPALPVLEQAVAQVLERRPRVVGIAVVHPEHRVQGLALAVMLRRAGFAGKVVWYGAFEDVLAPSDFAADLVAGHRLFRWLDGVIVGDAGDTLVGLATGGPTPNLVSAEGVPSQRLPDPLGVAPVFDFVDPSHHPFPSPIVDVRLGRGCPWGRCRFCGIQAHHPGYRAGRIDDVVQAIERARSDLGSRMFRVRDDLLTPRQLSELGQAIRGSVHWMARARFTSALTESVLREAMAGGLSELWLGLESAVPRVRQLMDKGVPQEQVERVLDVAERLGLRVRLLTLVGFPGETEAEAEATLRFVEENLHRLAGVSVTPYMAMRSAPLPTDVSGGDRRERLDAIAPSPPDALGPEALQRVLTRLGPIEATLRKRGVIGPDPSHDWWAAVSSGAPEV